MQVSPHWRRILKRVPGLRFVVRRARRVLDPAIRSLATLSSVDAARLLQPSNRTCEDRWPAFFSFVATALASVSHPRVLSYGCATGEEVFSLRHYLPHAELVGIDISPYNIARCMARLSATPDRAIHFRRAADIDDEPAERYDAIFCMAVLRHGALGETRPERCDAFIRFAEVDALVSALARALKPGGYLAIWSSHFRVADMRVARDFDVVLHLDAGARFNTPLYGPDNQRLPDTPYCEAIFRKRRSDRLG